MLTFEELTDARRSLQSFCFLHVPSLLALKSGISFKLFPSETPLESNKVRHLTTSATCYSSLLESPVSVRTKLYDFESDRQKFAEKALEKPDWTSDGSGEIYCRCRALPMVIEGSAIFNSKIQEHITAILAQLEEKPDRFAIGEASAKYTEDKWYPPNAFHTFWTLETLNTLNRKYPAEYTRMLSELDLVRRRKGMLLWARKQLGHQIGLHSSSPGSSVLDSDQLAWSIAIFFRFDEDLNLSLENRDFAKQALKCLFSTQTDGTWRHYRPLFHYRDVGNAYCYVFETFTSLLQCAFQERPEAEMIRELLRPYDTQLLDLWRYANSTRIPFSGKSEKKIVGWCSGHRTNVETPESWASASVFAYSQALRRLFGIWCREEALDSFSVPHTPQAPEVAAQEMISRGETWGSSNRSIVERLRTLFINPVRMHQCIDRLEPDNEPIEKNHARSAILFGPPGTSKTTLIRSLADVIGWNYIEIHASHFVAEGLTQVQKTADSIFKRLSELDHVVVLFDEIDELVRERDMEKDAFGRFLTTSMLPKLAELWAARKVLYFVATNHINYFDSAIIRSHRFDALMLVSPPSLQVKKNRLLELLNDLHGFPNLEIVVDETSIQNNLNKLQRNMESLRTPPKLSAKMEKLDNDEMRIARWREQPLDPRAVLAKMALLRYDELNELAARIAGLLNSEPKTPKSVSLSLLKKALLQVSDSEWRKNKSYVDYIRDTQAERRDYQMSNVWELIGAEANILPGAVVREDTAWFSSTVDSLDEIKIDGFELHEKPPGCIEVRRSSSKMDRNNKTE
jgi:ATPase family associated with various cellular activities (AAA)